MFSAAIIVFRETLEAALLVGIIVHARLPRRARSAHRSNKAGVARVR